jgi:ABC-type multidrug transport system ATPase subunit
MKYTIPDISIKYPKGNTVEVIFDNLSVDIESGISLLVGRNGAGKSSLMRYLFDDLSRRKQMQNKVCYLPQNFQMCILPWLSIEQNIRFFRGLSTDSYDFKMGDLLIQKAQNTLAKNLSGGNQQLLAIYNCLAMRPSIILLDEPLSGLDTHNYQKILELILHYQRETGSIVLICDHVLDSSVKVADNCMVVTSDTSKLTTVSNWQHQNYDQRKSSINKLLAQN